MPFETIGKRIKAIRTSNDLSQKEFAARIGINQGHLSKIERGKTNPSPRLIRLISIQFNIDEAWLLVGDAGKVSLAAIATKGYEYISELREKEANYIFGLIVDTLESASDTINCIRLHLDSIVGRTIVYNEKLALYDNEKIKVSREKLITTLRSFIEALDIFLPPKN